MFVKQSLISIVTTVFLLLIASAYSSIAGSSPGVAAPQKNGLENAFLSLQKLAEPPAKSQTPCMCGVFLSGQFTKGSPEPPKGNPALLYEQTALFTCNAQGNKQCTNRCLEVVNLIALYSFIH